MRPPGRGPAERPAWRPGEVPDVQPPRITGARADTVWFGGDDGSGIGFEGCVWDWDTIITDPFQGWTAIDETGNPAGRAERR